MQIFSPFSDFYEIASCLDNKRLNKQKVEIYQILNTILKGESAKGWKNHPAVKMARGYEQFFIEYSIIIIDECKKRGLKDTMLPKFLHLITQFPIEYKIPPYWGNEKFHLSHKSNLIRKLSSHYRPIFGNDIPDNLPYFWPI